MQHLIYLIISVEPTPFDVGFLLYRILFLNNLSTKKFKIPPQIKRRSRMNSRLINSIIIIMAKPLKGGDAKLKGLKGKCTYVSQLQ